MMEIKLNHVYAVDNEITYLCIGYTKDKKEAILAPFWSDDEDNTPQIQNDDYIVEANPTQGTHLTRISAAWVRGRVELV